MTRRKRLGLGLHVVTSECILWKVGTFHGFSEFMVTQGLVQPGLDLRVCKVESAAMVSYRLHIRTHNTAFDLGSHMPPDSRRHVGLSAFRFGFMFGFEIGKDRTGHISQIARACADCSAVLQLAAYTISKLYP